MSKKARQKFKFLRTKKAFKVKKKGIFRHFQRPLVAKNFLRLESVPLMSNLMIGKKKKVAAFIKKFLKNSSLLLLEQKKKRSEKVFFIATNN